MNISKLQKKLALIAACFVVVVIALGAFTRLVEAGLGCPDWPGCYGFVGIPMKAETIAKANAAFPDQPYELARAWPEMVHRYFAGTLGLLIFALFILAAKRLRENNSTFKLSSVLLVLIVFQAALGAWTVTHMLHPLIVMGHLLGGFTTFALLAVLAIRLYQPKHDIQVTQVAPLKLLTNVSITVLLLQIALGGWTSANYAALSCTELPICFAGWSEYADFATGFQFWGLEADTYQYGIFSTEARIAIHASHRFGAIVTTLVILALVFKMYQQRTSRTIVHLAWAILVTLSVQVLLGVSNVVFHLPLSVAVAHNGVAAFLLILLVGLRTLFWLKENHAKRVYSEHRVGQSNG